MLKSIFYPTHQNLFTWLSALYLLLLLYIGKTSPIEVLFIYFLETIIIGVFNALKMFFCKTDKKEETFGLILFFLFHYGFFVTIQSVFAFAIFSFGNNTVFKEPFNLIENYIIILNLKDINYALPVIFLTNFGKFYTDFIQNKKFLKFTSKEIMFSPYIRIFIQQFVVIISLFFLILSEVGNIVAILLIAFRLIIDLILESVNENSKTLNIIAEKLANKKVSKEYIKKQLIKFTE